MLLARHDILPGTVIVTDTALVSTPDGHPVCVGCLASITALSVPCTLCGWMVCGQLCQEAETHREECRLFRENNIVPTIHYVHYLLPHGLYLVLQVLRVLLVTKDNIQEDIEENKYYKSEKENINNDKNDKLENPCNKKNMIYGLMSHISTRCRDSGVYEMVKYVTAYCRVKLGLQWVTEAAVLHAYGVLKTNAVGHVTCTGGRQCYLYPTVSLLSHSCAPNMEMVGIPANKVQMVATRCIKQGEELTWRLKQH